MVFITAARFSCLFRSAVASFPKHSQNPIAHRNPAPATRRLAVRHEDELVGPVDLFDSDAIGLSFVPHARVPHQGYNIVEEFKTLRPPATETCSDYELCFHGSVKRQGAAVFFDKSELRRPKNELPFFSLVQHPSQTSTVEQRRGGEGVSLLGEVTVNEDSYSQVGTPISARIVKINAGPGQRVTKGMQLAVLQSTEIGKVRSESITAHARLRSLVVVEARLQNAPDAAFIEDPQVSLTNKKAA